MEAERNGLPNSADLSAICRRVGLVGEGRFSAVDSAPRSSLFSLAEEIQFESGLLGEKLSSASVSLLLVYGVDV